MGPSGALLLPVALVASILWLAIGFYGGALGNDLNLRDLPDSVHFGIAESLVQSMRPTDFAEGTSRLQNHLQSLGQTYASMTIADRRASRLLRNQVAAARWLSSVTCKILGSKMTRISAASTTHIYAPGLNVLSDEDPHSLANILWDSFKDDQRVGKFFAGVEECLQVELGWSDDAVSMLPTVLQARLLWANAPALLSISPRSWSVLDADELATLIHFRADPTWRDLPTCVGIPSRWVPEQSGLQRFPDATHVDKMLAATAGNAFGFAVEQLHIAMHDYDSEYFLRQTENSMSESGLLRRVLPDGTFSTFATSLLSAPFLWKVSLSWDVHRSDSATVERVEAMATALTMSKSVRTLAVMRTCSSPEKRNRGPDPLAAFTHIASAGGTWPTVETLSLTTHRLDKDPRPPSEYDLKALPIIAKHMPSLRHVHFEYRSMGLEFANQSEAPALSRLQLPSVQDVLRLVPPHVTAAVAVDLIGIAGVARAHSLAPVGETLSDGYAAVVYAVPVDGGVPERQLELVGDNVLRETTAISLLPADFPDYGNCRFSRSGKNEWLGWFELRMPRLERLAIDCRWTSAVCNDFVGALPPTVGSRLRALMVHFLRLWSGEGSAACEVVQGILQAGHDNIMVVDLGIDMPMGVADSCVDCIESLAHTLNLMSSLTSVTLTLTSTSPDDDMVALGKLVEGILPQARVSAISKQWLPSPNVDQLRKETVAWWQFGPSAAIPSTRVFPSPKQIFAGL